MAEIRNHLEDDEDQELERAKQMWRNYGKPILGGVIIAVIAVLGWQWWQNHQAERQQAASLRYSQLVTLVSGQSLDEGARSNALELASQLESEFGGSLYADLAGLIEARVLVEGDSLDRAAQALNNLMDRTERGYVQSLARLDLARIQLARSNPEQALATLDQHDFSGALGARALDVRGDILKALDRPADARKAWQQALQTAQENDQPAFGIQLKLDDLAPAEAS
ncbi:putative negative regulator of RcsB-dependent stress response [Kushneria sinocarnis]|uniref:Ancillary SecYEG translocon subunit n=1 Tax=Kushneria sinocarnis TaxID=595502 RepID=A0A420X076_9GAMM|nr:tetratricopeptide repeat protein [Kushneria sinocarnis]RKR06910.1 putative negative regulator of RcsB-dependent stress response [Kushneria sinocarnis]